MATLLERPRPTRPVRKLTMRGGRPVLMLGTVLIVGVLTAYPLLLILLQSVRTGIPGQASTWSLESYMRVFSDPSLLGSISSTFAIAIPTVAISTVLAIVFSWLVTRTDLPYKRTIEVLLWAGILVPSTTQALGWILLLDPHYGLLNEAATTILPFLHSGPFNAYSYPSIIWANLAPATAFRFLLIAPAFRNLDASLEEAARVSGRGPWSTLMRITTPLLTPAILAAAFLGLIIAVESFEVPLLLGAPANIRVFSTQVYALVTSYSGSSFSAAAALSTVFLVVVLGLAWLYNRSLAGTSFTTLTGKTTHQAPVRLSQRTKATVLAGIGLYFFAVILLPILVTLLGTFMSLFGFFNISPVFTLANWVTTLSNPTLLNTVVTTVVFSLIAAVVGMVAYFFISYLIIRVHPPGHGLLRFLSWLPWATPGILLGYGLLQMFLNTPGLGALYGTVFAMSLAIIITQVPLGVQMVNASLLQHSKDLEDVGRVSGAGTVYRLWRIVVPLTVPTLLTVGLLVFAAAARDVATITLLSSGNLRTLSLLTIDYVSTPDLGAASVSGFLLVVLIMVAAAVYAVLTRRRAA